MVVVWKSIRDRWRFRKVSHTFHLVENYVGTTLNRRSLRQFSCFNFELLRVWLFLHDQFSHSPPPLRGLIFGLSDVDNFTEMARFLSRTHSLKIMPRHSTRLGWWCCDVARSALCWLESMCVNFSSLSVCCCSFFFRGEVIGELCSSLTFSPYVSLA